MMEFVGDGLTRRRFLQHAGTAAGAVALAGSWECCTHAEETAGPAGITGKRPGLIVHKADPPEVETPLRLLRDHRITPVELLFVRNNQFLAGSLTTEPLVAADWSIELAGLIDKPRTIQVRDLASMEQVEQVLVLQCSGNGRASFSRTAMTEGSQWQHGAMGNIRFKGVRLKSLLEKLGAKLQPEARFLTAEGRDAPTKPGAADFEHSLPLGDALARSFLALELNGKPLAAVHGGPVRLVTPGYYGTMHVKWVNRLRFEAGETANHHQMPRYRTPLESIAPGTKFSYTFENSEPNWRMRIKSVIFAPLSGETVAAGPVEVRGVAWNDGSAKIVNVDVSADDGVHWQRAQLEVPDGPYAWHPWSTSVRLEKGIHRLRARAVDALGRTQPLDGAVFWNQPGYTWNGVDAVEVNVS